MPSLKDILILIFVLAGCLIIAFSGQEQPLQQIKETNNEVVQDSRVIPTTIFSSEETITETDSPVRKSAAPASPKSKVFGALSETDYSETDNTKLFLSLETVLAEVENLSSELKLEFEYIQEQKENCPSCSQPENSSPSICAVILAAPGGGACNCGTLNCTPEKGTWCVHPCCCVCCAACCR